MPPYYALGIIQGTSRNVKDAMKLIEDSESYGLSLGGYHIDNYYNPGDLFEVSDSDLKTIKDTLALKKKILILGLQSSYKDDT